MQNFFQRLTTPRGTVTLERRSGRVVVTVTAPMNPHGAQAMHHLATHPADYLRARSGMRVNLPDREMLRRAFRPEEQETALRALQPYLPLAPADRQKFGAAWEQVTS